MACRKIVVLLLMSWSIASIGRADSLDIEFKRVLTAVAQDSAYSRLYFMDLKRPNLPINGLRHKDLERTFSYDTISSGGSLREYVYRFVYVPVRFSFGGVSLPLVPLIAEETTTEGERAPQGSVRPVTNNRLIFDLQDFAAMKRDFSPEFMMFVQQLSRYHIEGRGVPLGSKIRGNPIQDTALIADGNRDYFRHIRLSNGYVGNPHGDEPISLDLTWSALKLSLDFASEEQWIGVHSFGVEVGVGDRLLSLLSYQSPYISWGGRLLVFFGGEYANIDTSFFFDLRILARTAVNTNNLIQRWRLDNRGALATLQRSVLNVTSGAGVELRTGRPFSNRLPFFTFYYSGGATEFEKPFVKLKQRNRDIAYFSTVQWEVYLTHYWNLEREAHNTIKLDIGAGSYDIWEAVYDTSGKLRSYDQNVLLSAMKPLIVFEYMHDSKATRFGATTRFFDNRLIIHPWIKIFRSGPHEIRLESIWLTRVFGRSPQPWEVEKGSMMQLRYRFGL